MATLNTQTQQFLSTTEALISSAKSSISQFEELKRESVYTIGNPHIKTAPFSKLIQDIGQHLSTLISQIEQAVGHSSFIHHIKTSQHISNQLRKLIEKCALIEMKSLNTLKVTAQLKVELKRLQHLQKNWFNTACLKN